MNSKLDENTTAVEESVNDYSPAEQAHDAEQDRMESERQFSLWQAKTTLAGKLWDIRMLINGIKHDAVMIADEQPTERMALALIATLYKYDIHWVIDLREKQHQVLLISPAYLWEEDDIKDKYIPF